MSLKKTQRRNTITDEKEMIEYMSSDVVDKYKYARIDLILTSANSLIFFLVAQLTSSHFFLARLSSVYLFTILFINVRIRSNSREKHLRIYTLVVDSRLENKHNKKNEM